MKATLDKFGGDIVQCVQALKESDPEKTTELRTVLKDLLDSLSTCQKYCLSSTIQYPFERPERQVRDVLTYLYPEDASQLATSSSVGLLDISLLGKLSLETFMLGTYQIPRLFNGFWQLSSPAWGSGSEDSQKGALVQLIEAGLVASDMADHYVRRCLTPIPYIAN